MISHPHTPQASYPAIDRSPRQHRLDTGLSLVLLFVLGLANAILITSLYNTLLLDTKWVSWTLATITALGAATLAFTAGRCAAIAYTTRERAHTLTAVLASAAWVLVGASLFWLRANTTALPYVSAVTDTATDQLLAVVLITLHLMAGTIAATHAFRLTAAAHTTTALDDANQAPGSRRQDLFTPHHRA